MKLFALLLISAFALQSNVYDFDPYCDNPRATYGMLGLAKPFAGAAAAAKPAQHPAEEPPGFCGDYAPGDPNDPHPCSCARTEDPPEGQTCPPPSTNGERPENEGPKCYKYCYGSHCHCTNSCDD
jgi:hypothetical protein